MAGRRIRKAVCSPAKRWRPVSRSGPECGYSFDEKVCSARGTHYCEPRADRVVAFFAELLVHTKGPWARKAFVLEPWQEVEIVRPLFGEVIFSTDFGIYVRRYSVAIIVLARKNGKSELAAGICLYMLVGDDEEGAEVYGAAADTKQARKVWEPAERMRTLSPDLNSEQGGRLGVNKTAKRIFDLQTASFYEVITADALGELGHNPHLFCLDEVLSQPDATLWEAMRTADGTRTQPLMLAITTETNEPASFGADLIDEAERVEANPRRAPHVFAYVRKTPTDADPFDEKNWYLANPALGTFKTLRAMRTQALEAKNEPAKENAFRQFQLNQRVSQVTRFMPLHLWDATAGIVDEAALAGETCFAGLDLASTTDLAAWVLLFPPAGEREHYEVLWRFWTPDAQISRLDKYTANQASVWVRDGLLVATDGDWIDYDGAIHPKIASDARTFRIAKVGYDSKEATATAQYMQGLELEIESIYQGFGLSSAIKESMRLTKAKVLHHGGHAVARWNADSVETKQDDQERLKLVKPVRAKTGKRIDGYAALCNAIKTYQLTIEEPEYDAAGASAPRDLAAASGDFFRPKGRLGI